MKLRLLFCLFGAAIIIANCGGSVAQTQEQQLAPPTATDSSALEAIQAVLSSSQAKNVYRSELIFDLFPKQVDKANCRILGYGPSSEGIGISGTCETTVEADGTSWVVKFTEIWKAADFHYVDDPSNGELQHTWQFMVNDKAQIVDYKDFGHFPPQHVH